MKKLILLVLTLALVLGLTAGCGRKEEPVPEASGSSTAQQPEPKEEPEEDLGNKEIVPFTPLIPAQPGTEEPEDPSDPAVLTDPDNPQQITARQAYAGVLTRLYEDHLFPDDTPISFDPAFYTMEQNKFFVGDVDRDGREELVIKYISADVAGHRGMVLDYDGEQNKIRVQLDEYPAINFFENGSILVHWSHNQGKGGAFWPYSIYTYRPEQDSYSYVGSVDAWDRTIDTASYPEEADVSQTGFVYYISTGGAFDFDHPMDSADYQKWLTPYIGEAKLLEYDYLNLTEDNIATIAQKDIREPDETPAP